ncbi:MAG: right-handed parallel beta-helix repeat-containing protein [Methylobacteriaceae bacterium]|nr:right-handed parallel beta-helix repeat-containing protein [Methylobacteriaceae bacterium]
MNRIALWLVAFAALSAAALPQAANAQNDRSWVAGAGLDGNPCTRSQPCATFTRALAQTNAGGEINCVDQGDFGGGVQVTITKSVTIDCEGVQGRVTLNAQVDAFAVEAGATDVVVLRGLDIDGTGTGLAGIGFSGGAALHVENCVIHDFAAPAFNNSGWGIFVLTSGNMTAELFVSDTVLVHNGAASTGGGILIAPNLANSITKVVLDRVEVRDNFFGIKVDGTESFGGGVVNMTVRDSVSAGNGSNGIVGTGNGSGPVILMMIDRSASSHNAAGFGVIADGPKTTIRLGGSSIAGNINGVGVSNGGVLQSFGTNQIAANSNDGLAALTPIGLH